MDLEEEVGSVAEVTDPFYCMSQENKIHFAEVFDAQDWAGVDWGGHRFFYCQANHVRIDQDTNLYGATFMGCFMTFLEAEDVEIEHASFEACDLRHGNFKGSRWRRSRIHNSNLGWSTFEGADVADCSGEGSDFYLSRIQKAARVNPFDRDMVSELIRCAARGDVEVLQVAALVKVSKDLCWREWKTFSQLPNLKRVAEIIYPILESYPSIRDRIADGVIRGD